MDYVHLGKSPKSDSNPGRAATEVFRLGGRVCMWKERERRRNGPSWDLPWGGPRTVPENLCLRDASCITIVFQGNQLSSCPEFFADVVMGYRRGNHVAWGTQCLWSESNPMLTKHPLCWEQPLIDLEQPSRECPVCLFRYLCAQWSQTRGHGGSIGEDR